MTLTKTLRPPLKYLMYGPLLVKNKSIVANLSEQAM